MIMGSGERSKKKVQLWKKAIIHFSLCFAMGFFTGFAPTGKSSIFSPATQETTTMTSEKLEIPLNNNRNLTLGIPVTNSSYLEESDDDEGEKENSETEETVVVTPRRLLIIITPLPAATEPHGHHRGVVMLGKMANTIRLIPPPVLWVVVEKRTESEEVSEMLRKTGIMFRHIDYKENFTKAAAEADHQRSLALRHVKEHRLSGIIHFAPISNVYDLNFFNELREIKVFGTWPVAILSVSQEKVAIEGPVCNSSQLLGWHLREMNNNDMGKSDPRPRQTSSFAFNSSVLWDPERWGRPSSSQATSDQDSIKFVKEIVDEDEANVKGIPGDDCSKIMVWHLQHPGRATPAEKSTTAADSNDDDGEFVRRDQ